MFNILHLFVDKTGCLYNLDKTIIVNEKSDIVKILDYNIIVVISETSSAIYTRGKHFPDHTVNFFKINIMEELLKIYYCKYDTRTRIFAKENINIYSLNNSSSNFDLTKRKVIHKFNDYNENQNTNLMSETRYQETKYTLSEFINLISDDNNILINDYNLWSSKLRSEIEFYKNKIYEADKQMIKIDDIVINNITKELENLMKPEMKKIQDIPYLNDILELKILDVDLKTNLIGYKIDEKGILNCIVCDPESFLGFVPEYYITGKKPI